MKLIWILLALLYTLWPIDIISDLIPGAGWIDDAAVWLLVIQHLLRQKARTDARRRYHQRRASGEKPHESPGSSSDAARDPHEVLGVAADAAPAEIKAAYRRLANQYHPDKVSHLGEEFQNLAESRFKEIQAAYRELMQQNR